MYFENIKLININEIINSNYKIYAHTNNGENEYLLGHIELCLKYFLSIIGKKNINEIFEKIESIICENMSLEQTSLFREMLINTIILHDIGKANALYQKNKLDNDLNIKVNDRIKYTDHSLLSAIIYIDEYYNKIVDCDGIVKSKLFKVMILNAYAISRHHGDLKSINEFMNKFDKYNDSDNNGYRLIYEYQTLYSKTLSKELTIKCDDIDKIFYYIDDFKNNMNKDFDICCYIYERLVLSLLYTSDYYATSEFMSGFEIKDIGIINEINEFYDVYKETEIYKFIRQYEQNEYKKNEDLINVDNINILRNELFLDAEESLLSNIDKDIFYLEAPTGSGKSNVAFNLSFKLLKKDSFKNKIFYVYPFNNLVEQNLKSLEKIFGSNKDVFSKIAVINSIKPVKMDEKILKDEENISLEYYKKALLNKQFLNYPVILTTHVTLFNYLFGVDKENIFPVFQLANSVIILDEIQSYKNKIWGEIITFLNSYSSILNIKIIIMSATLPDLNLLSLVDCNTVKLIEDRKKYFSHPKFKNRVNVNYELLEYNDVEPDLYNHIKNKSLEKKKILVEFISKDSAYEFYEKLMNDIEILSQKELMTGDDNIAERERILKEVSEAEHDEGVILVATQVVEAGIDLDMDYGYKDISLFDSEEQFLGRINRSCKNKGEAFFFNLIKTGNIYKGDIRTNEDLTLKDMHIREMLRDKNTYEYYKTVMDRLKLQTNKFNKDNIEKFFNEEVKNLDFMNIEERMKLICDDNNKITLYLSTILETESEILDGSVIWNKYKELLEDMKMDYSEKRVKLSQIKSKMNYFIYEIKWKLDFIYEDRIGDIYYIEDGDKYFVNGKFDRDKFKKGIGDFI